MLRNKPKVKAFFSLDTLFAFIPLALLIYAYIKIMIVMSYDEYINDYSLKMKKLLVFSDYVIEESSVYDYKLHPNWMFSLKGTNESGKLGIDATMGFSPTSGNCIVRYVAFGEAKEVRKLYACLEG